jgi:hypothetical protein
MWNLLRVRTGSCTAFASDLQDAADRLPPANPTRVHLRAELSREMREHADHCENCSQALDDLLAVRRSLQLLRPLETPTDPWFAPRVMHLISARERAAESGNPTWRAVPRVASRLAGAAVVVLLLAGTWVVRNPAAITSEPSATMVASEGLFDSPQPVASHDDPLASVLERDR